MADLELTQGENLPSSVKTRYKDLGNGVYALVISTGGSGTNIGSIVVTSGNIDANLQVGDVDVSNANPVPISDAGSTTSVDDNNGSLTVDDGGTSLAVNDDGNELSTASVGVEAARNGSGFCRWLNDKTGVNSLTVLTDGPSGDQPGIYYNLSAGETVFITAVCFELTSVSDDVRVELGVTSDVNGTGTFAPRTPLFRAQTGANNFTTQAPLPYTFDETPLAITYAAGSIECITMRVQTNDAAARIMVAYRGWSET